MRAWTLRLGAATLRAPEFPQCHPPGSTRPTLHRAGAMSLPRFTAGRRRAPALLPHLWIALAVLAIIFAAASASAGERAPASHAMSNEDMERWVKEWYAKNPVRGLGTAAFPPAATFRVLSSSF